MLAGPRGEMMRILCLACRMGGTRVSLSGGIKCGLSCWDGGVLARWDEPAGGCAVDCC